MCWFRWQYRRISTCISICVGFVGNANEIYDLRSNMFGFVGNTDKVTTSWCNTVVVVSNVATRSIGIIANLDIALFLLLLRHPLCLSVLLGIRIPYSFKLFSLPFSSISLVIFSSSMDKRSVAAILLTINEREPIPSSRTNLKRTSESPSCSP